MLLRCSGDRFLCFSYPFCVLNLWSSKSRGDIRNILGQARVRGIKILEKGLSFVLLTSLISDNSCPLW